MLFKAILRKNSDFNGYLRGQNCDKNTKTSIFKRKINKNTIFCEKSIFFIKINKKVKKSLKLTKK